MSKRGDFKTIAVIGAGTMGAGIAGHIANAGHGVLLMDLPLDASPNGRAEAAVERLLKSDPPALMHKKRAGFIRLGNTRDDFAGLAECDWIIEAVVERLDIKKDLYKRLAGVISDTCVVTSNTSTIPIRLLVEDMDLSFRRRFAITHYFNPVRYMRLLELVKGADTEAAIIDRLADYNDRVLGKGVVQCRDTPGFLGNRVGVYALQVGMDEAVRCGLDIEDADALMGRPMGIPKTGIFGLYDLIGIDLMADVVRTLGVILPEGDAFHAVGESNALAGRVAEMVRGGFIGDKSPDRKGGFYRQDDAGRDGAATELAMNLAGTLAGDLDLRAAWRPRKSQLPPQALRASETLASGGEPLHDLIASGDAQHVAFCRRVLGRVLGYAAGLLGEVAASPQDIDDAMKLGFNWIRGPFEMIDALGADTLAGMLEEIGADVPPIVKKAPRFYEVKDGALHVRCFENREAAGGLEPVRLPQGAIRFHLLKQGLKPLARNHAASLYALDDDMRLVEFHSKANALNGDSVAMLARAAQDHGSGIILHNDAQHFSAGVDLNHFLALIEAEDWGGIDAFLKDFQQAVQSLRDAPVPVIAANSGLTIGGGYEVVAHADKVIAHGNSVMGLVEAAVGLVPGGGGVKETFFRFHETLGDWHKAAWQTWMQIGYARTGSSPEQSMPLMYFLEGRDVSVMNRDRLLPLAIENIKAMNDGGYEPRGVPEFILPGDAILEEMAAFMDKGIADGLFFPHDKTVALAVAGIVVSDDSRDMEADEDALYARERRAFLSLARTPETKARIVSMLESGAALRN